MKITSVFTAFQFCLEMAVFEIYSHPELRRYRTNVCSKATIFQILVFAVTLISPLLIAHRSQGFWQRHDLYLEQAEVHFKHEILLIIDTQTDYIAWSTYQNFNQIQQAHLRVPIIKSREEDGNRDGKYDRLHLTAEMPMLDTEDVLGVKLLLIFDYKLHKFSSFQMESLAYIHHESPRPGAAYNVLGDLKLKQRQVIGHKGSDTRYNTPIIDSTNLQAGTFDFSEIFATYSSRNMSTYFDGRFPIWKTVRGASQPFVIEATINYPEESIFYTPGFWQLIKWAWVQYVAILIVFVFVLERIKVFVFQHQIVNTIVDRPFKEHHT